MDIRYFVFLEIFSVSFPLYEQCVDEENIILLTHLYLFPNLFWLLAMEHPNEFYKILTQVMSQEPSLLLSKEEIHFDVLAPNTQKYKGRVDELPVDQHMIMACVAP
jgi:hypothetical protein